MKSFYLTLFVSFISFNLFTSSSFAYECRIYEYCGPGGNPDQPVCQNYLPIECVDLRGNEDTIFLSGKLLKENHSMSFEYKNSIRYKMYDEYQILIDRTLKYPSMLWLKSGDEIKALRIRCKVQSVTKFICSIIDPNNEFNQDFIEIL